jgi:hypothetical protein
MANLNQPRGMEPVLTPYGGLKRTKYRVYASAAAAIYIGDPVARSGDGVVDLVTAGAGNALLGPVVEAFDSTGKPVSYVPATPTGYTVTVADDPAQEFVMQEDGDTSDLALTDIGTNVDLINGSASTITKMSGWQIDSDSTSNSASVQLRIIDKVDEPNNAIGDYCRWKVTINNHQNSVGIVGVGV